MGLAVSIPGGYRAAAGGDAALDAWFDAVRAFVRETGFFAYEAKESAYFDALTRAAREEAGRALTPKAVADYLGRPLAGRRAYALSPL